MSIKIWEAYRLDRRRDMFDVLFDIQNKARKRASRVLEILYAALVESPDEFEPRPGRVGKRPTYLDASRWVRDRYLDQLTSSEKNVYDLSVSVTVRRSDLGDVLLIPYRGSGIMSSVLDCMKRHPALRDFHYQNCTDPDPEVSPREWRRRGQVWAPLLYERWTEQLVLEIVSWDGFSRIDPTYDLMRRG